MPPPPLDGWLSPFLSSPPAHSSCPAPQSRLAVPVPLGPCELPGPRLPMPGLFCPSALALGWVKGYSGAQPRGNGRRSWASSLGRGPFPPHHCQSPLPPFFPQSPQKGSCHRVAKTGFGRSASFQRSPYAQTLRRSDQGGWKFQASDLTLCPSAVTSGGWVREAEDARERSVAIVTKYNPSRQQAEPGASHPPGLSPRDCT